MMLFSVPLLLNILGKHNYGVWTALTSLLVWISLFDFGVGHALKNTVSKGVAKNNFVDAKYETIQNLRFLLIFCICLSLLLILAINKVELLKDNKFLVLILFVPSIIIFPLTMGSMILQGTRKVALQSGLMLIGPSFFFACLLIGNVFSFQFDLILLGIMYTCSMSVPLFLVWFMSTKQIGLKISDYKKITTVVINYARLRLGLKFFGLQISSIVLYNMGPFMIISFMSAEDVTHFDILNKVFIFGISLFSIGFAVFWPELSYYRESKNYKKVNRIYYIMITLSVLFSLGAFVFAFMAPYAIRFWVGSSIQVLWNEAIYFSMLVSIQAMAYSGAVVLNVYERINVQLVIAICSTLFMLPLTLFLINSGYGIVSIPLAASLLTLTPAIYCNLHAFKILKEERLVYAK